MLLETITILVNAVFLIAATVATIWMARLGAQNMYYLGIIEKTEAIKWKVIKVLLFLISLGLVSIVFNLVIGFFR